MSFGDYPQSGSSVFVANSIFNPVLTTTSSVMVHPWFTPMMTNSYVAPAIKPEPAPAPSMWREYKAPVKEDGLGFLGTALLCLTVSGLAGMAKNNAVKEVVKAELRQEVLCEQRV